MKVEIRLNQMKTIGYIRSSTARQDISLEAQEEKIRAMCHIKGFALADLVIDRDEFSGSLDRPGVQRVIEMVEKKEIDAIVIYRLDRLTRSTRDAISFIELCRRKRVTLVSVTESLDTASATGRFFVRTLASLAELERETIADRTRMALRHLKEQGYPAGPAPYGWRAQPRPVMLGRRRPMPLIKDEAEAKVVERILALRARSVALRDIASALNGEGFLTRSGKPWRFQYVARIIRNLSTAGKACPPDGVAA